jgi:RNA polymerase-binding transcription factor DksA
MATPSDDIDLEHVRRDLEARWDGARERLAELGSRPEMCDVCGDPIPPGRLRALPDAVLCLRCAETQRRSSVPRRR